MRSRHILLSLLACLLLLSNCGVPEQSSPVRVPPADLPSPLRQGGSAEPTAQASVDPAKSYLVYFVRNDRLVGLAREEAAGSAADRLDAILGSLAAGPTQSEEAAGITTALPPGLHLKVSEVRAQQAILDLSGETDGRSATDNLLIVGQIVLSVTSLPGVNQVAFVRDGSPVEALLPGGALTADPLTASDYQALRSR
ncbi:GerMN domain-containing protein [Kribbella catacumbae]|uniref:GerMN domain-containing protein n=1 Tax=Kribbella catacumbae TaxID=460086 RepID=UPI00037C390E|nr:GerMN domain-containing protein [Kribbella catacumbae]